MSRQSGKFEPIVYGGLLIVALGTWAFVGLAKQVVAGKTQTLDERMMLMLRADDDGGSPIGPPWMEEMGRDLSALGGYVVLSMVLLAVTGFLCLERKFRRLWFVWSSVAGGYVLVMALKSAIDRPRPDIVSHLSIFHSASFPSGHSMMSAVVYLTLGALLAESTDKARVKFYVLSVPLVLSGLVGMSRVYVGVHYPSDVLAGWSAGLVWATACWMLARFLSNKGLIEAPEEQPA